MSPAVAATSANATGLSFASTSVIESAPLALSTESSDTAPVNAPVMTEASSVPVIVTVTTCVEPSLAVKVCVSNTVCPASRFCTAALFSA